MKKLLIVLLLAVGACTCDEATRRTLESSGYTDIHVGDHSFFSCSDDAFSNSFTATNPVGKRVSGVVCCGILKDCTVRF